MAFQQMLNLCLTEETAHSALSTYYECAPQWAEPCPGDTPAHSEIPDFAT